MSQEYVEIVRFAYEEGLAKRTTDHPDTPERFADDFRFHARRGFPGRPVYRLDQVTELWADLDATFTDYSIYPDGYESIGEYVLVRIRQSARLKGSDKRLDDTLYHLWHVVDGKAKEGWAYGRREEALEAAGLSE